MSESASFVGRSRQALSGFYRESLIKNASLLLVSSAVMSGMGFIFWVIAARIFSKDDVGVASVLLTAASFITTVGLLGLDSGLMRFLASSPEPKKQLESTVALVGLATLAAGVVYILLTPALSAKLAFLRHDYLDAAVLLAFLLALVTNALLQATFIAKRRAEFVLVGNSIFSVLKVAVLPALTVFGAMGILSAGWLALLVSIVVCVWILRARFSLSILPRFHRGALGHVRSYATTLFATGVENSVVQAVIPLVVLNRLGAARAADYYIVLSVASVLSMIPAATFQSLLAEGGHSVSTLDVNIHRSAKHVFALLLPAALALIVLGHYVLLLFGRSYADEGTVMLRLLALSAPFSALNYLADGVVNVRQQNRLFFAMNSFNSGAILVLCLLLVSHGLTGLGLAWLLGQVVTVAVYAVILRRDLPRFLRPPAS